MSDKQKTNSFIYSLIKDYWLDFKKNDELNKYQKNRWYYLVGVIISECLLATMVFFSAICFASFIGAIEAGSAALFFYFLPILVGLLVGTLIMDTIIKYLTAGLTKDWRYYIYVSETDVLCTEENLKKFDQRDKSIESNSPAALIRTLAVCVSDLLDAATTIITAIIQFVPCVIILFLINPSLPLITFFVCFLLLITCYQIAKIMNESQTKYMSFENQHLTYAEAVAANASSYSMMPQLLSSRKSFLNKTTEDANEARNDYRFKKSIFDFFASLAEKTVIYGPYLFFGYYAIQTQMSMAEFTLMVNTFIQASSNLMKINQIQTLLVKAKAAQEQYKQYKHILQSDIKPVIKTANSTNNDIVFDAKLLKLETTKPYKICIKDQDGRDVIQKFDPKNLSWEDQTPDFLNNKYCLTNYKGEFHADEPTLFNQKGISLLEKNTELVFADHYEYNYHLKFSIPFKAKVLIKGESGTGKSLIIKAISDNYRLGYGTIHLPDTSSILHITQETAVDVSKTYREELLSHLSAKEARDVPDERMKNLIKQYFGDQTGDVELDKTIGRLSGGQEQRFVLCRLLLKDPSTVKLITLDEPFGAVDSQKELEYLTAIYKHYKDSTILTISHSEINNNDGNSLVNLHNGILSLTSIQNTSIRDKSLFNTNDQAEKAYSKVEYSELNRSNRNLY